MLFSVAAAALAVSVGPTLSQAEEGLRGVLRFEVPAGLYEEDFLELGDSWESWSTGVSEEVTKFYEADDLNLE